MKQILITGKNSYIGQTFINWVKANNVDYKIDTIDLKNPDWKKHDFSIYDCLIHLAAIVHKKGQEEDIYYRINRDLAVETAKKAKNEGVKQFIFLSTMSVFGMNQGVINKETKLLPKTSYGKSKLEAEKEIRKLGDEQFIVSILRPPMVYGPNASGNYSHLSKLAKKINIFPKINNQRSMLFVFNLHQFLRIIIDNQLSGTFHPKNIQHINTSQLVYEIAKAHNKSMHLINIGKVIPQLLIKNITIFSKVFGTLVYDGSLSGSPNGEYDGVKFNYNNYGFKDSIAISERRKFIND
ncbi:sugar nucleotide-binding protein [Tetragenococcus koreensis]|uniref:NAD-dependent epimerase/dehydratase family protein n=1 Tax=Tetragenococcus koreensis TaxID=290335 RepID=UPI001F403041|nr:NAD-dependent epimerase/dehydratase family protein [Tetragenococcus koreensis]MCF1617090.1 sugar nucleotide-binding protein [Tetragenococcus koreensis]MCF1621979.1 sugar nucleotide-binding protein [Tetragenococcus koreensis]MCF1641822.1 sugar nucleotide-binding protein [Tetragenococcus koreensis]MCF1678049.1 sugar nucleotide-binding protein [Tetragenococcus koreensis]MCF1682752.1 sugar nucleotide-binding protein [Tetragenococcus koreensis]